MPPLDINLQLGFDMVLIMRPKYPKRARFGGPSSADVFVQDNIILTTGSNDTLESVVGPDTAQTLTTQANTSIWNVDAGEDTPSFFK